MPRIDTFRSVFFWKLYLTFAAMFILPTLVISIVIYDRLYSISTSYMHDGLKARVEYLSAAAAETLTAPSPNGKRLYFNDLAHRTETRITVIDRMGKVIAESDADPDATENHLQRPEVQQSLKSDYGQDERRSATTGHETVYIAKAVRTPDGSVVGFIRAALSKQSIVADLRGMQTAIALISVMTILAGLVLGWLLARKTTVPISEMVSVAESMRKGNYDARVKTITTDELGRLADTLNRLGAEITHKISELQRLENVRRDFVANVSHEIKTPLTSIKGYVETLMSGAMHDPEKSMRFLGKIDSNATRLTSLVQDILSLARIEAGEDSLQTTPVELGPVVQSVLHRHEPEAHGKQLQIRVTTPDEPVVVSGDREALTQILDNLLTNAIKYTPSGGRITVSVRKVNGSAKIEVEDTGIGISREHIDRIFERFYRVDRARSRDLGGTGLGLSIVKHLVSAMNGEVGVRSSPGAGSCFSVKLHLAV